MALLSSSPLLRTHHHCSEGNLRMEAAVAAAAAVVAAVRSKQPMPVRQHYQSLQGQLQSLFGDIGMDLIY
jgi:hypothetical protein